MDEYVKRCLTFCASVICREKTLRLVGVSTRPVSYTHLCNSKDTKTKGGFFMNQDISICVLTENEMGWTEPFELDKVQILDNYYLSAQKSDIAFRCV